MTGHGTRTSYLDGCGCDDCRRANTRYMARRRRGAGTEAAMERANRRRQTIREALAVAWVREHEPEVWAEFIEEARRRVAAELPVGPPPERVCDICGAVFAPKRHDSLRCSTRCIQKASERKAKAS